jgi:hypothetical protein
MRGKSGAIRDVAGQSACRDDWRGFRFSADFPVRGGWNTGQDKKKIGLPFNPDLLQDRTQLAAQVAVAEPDSAAMARNVLPDMSRIASRHSATDSPK